MDPSYTVSVPSPFRSITIAGFDAMAQGHMMTGLLEVDVTDLRRDLREMRRAGSQASLFSAVVWACARALAEYPEFNSMRWGRKIVYFREVNVNVPVERRAGTEMTVGSLVIPGADKLTLDEISARIEGFKSKDPAEEGGAVRGAAFLKPLLKLPRFLLVPLLRALSSSPSRVLKSFGGTMVSSVSFGGKTAGWALAPAFGTRCTLFAVGSIVPKPAAVGPHIAVREILHLTVQFNHDLVDGAAAARFVDRLVRILEGAAKR